MPQEDAQSARRKTSIAEKAAYSRAAQKKLTEAEIRLGGVKARIRSATVSGQLVVTRQLEDAQRAVDANLAEVHACLQRLRKSGDAEWKEHARNLDTAWEHLSGSIKRLVSCYSDGKE